MLKKKLLILIFSALGIGVAGQSNKGAIVFNYDTTKHTETFTFKNQYEHLKNAYAKLDVFIAMRNKDYRIVCIGGFALLYPGLGQRQKNIKSGLEGKYDMHLQKYGYKVICGTNDNLHTSVPGLQKAAYDYAEKYNTILLENTR